MVCKFSVLFFKFIISFIFISLHVLALQPVHNANENNDDNASFCGSQLSIQFMIHVTSSIMRGCIPPHEGLAIFVFLNVVSLSNIF